MLARLYRAVLQDHSRNGTHGKAVLLFGAFVPLSVILLLSAFAPAVPAPSGGRQETKNKDAKLHWDPPQVDAPLHSLSETPPCSLPDVLKKAGLRAAGLVDNLQNFDAQEHVRFEQIDNLGMPQISVDEKFDYQVDFGEQSGPIKVHETRQVLKGSDDSRLSAIVDKGLPAIALIFYPGLQGDYEMHCEGFTQWRNQPAWVLHFRQANGMPLRTLSISSTVQAYPLSLKGRAWIAPDSGQVMHLETNLVKGVPIIELQANAISIDYAPVAFKSQKAEIWLPQSATAYSDYGKRRTITEHTFSDFKLFSVQSQQVIQKPKIP